MSKTENTEVHSSPCANHYDRIQQNNESEARAYCGGAIKNIQHSNSEELKGTSTYFCTVETTFECHNDDVAPTPQIGNELESLVQGVHRSKGSGRYKGNGVYAIAMKDGGNRNEFWMEFKLTSVGGNKYRLDRLDAGDPDVILQKQGKVLTGGGYTLKFR